MEGVKFFHMAFSAYNIERVHVSTNTCVHIVHILYNFKQHVKKESTHI
jgi:hypothetical protein